MITDITFDLDAYRSDLGYCITQNEDGLAYISATSRWKRIEKELGEDFYFRQIVAFLSHESLHFMISKEESDPASTGLDNLDFIEGELWELAIF